MSLIKESSVNSISSTPPDNNRYLEKEAALHPKGELLWLFLLLPVLGVIYKFFGLPVLAVFGVAWFACLCIVLEDLLLSKLGVMKGFWVFILFINGFFIPFMVVILKGNKVGMWYVWCFWPLVVVCVLLLRFLKNMFSGFLSWILKWSFRTKLFFFVNSLLLGFIYVYQVKIFNHVYFSYDWKGIAILVIGILFLTSIASKSLLWGITFLVCNLIWVVFPVFGMPKLFGFDPFWVLAVLIEIGGIILLSLVFTRSYSEYIDSEEEEEEQLLYYMMGLPSLYYGVRDDIK